MDDWRHIRVEGISRIDRVVAVFEVWSVGLFPYGKVKVKVVEPSSGGYVGLANMAVKGPLGVADGRAGHGNTVEEALEDTILGLLSSIAKAGASRPEDFVWSDPQDF